MPKHRFSITMSLDGYMAGPRQSLENPLGENGIALHEWAFATRSFRATHDMGDEGDDGLDDRYAAAWNHNIGAYIMGRNMYGPIRGDWGDSDWKGWWGDEPPFRAPVFVLTHHAHEPIEMAGGTTFHFVTEGIGTALERAVAAAGDQDVMIGGGASTLQQYLNAGLVDEFVVHVVPLLLGDGERLFDNLAGAGFTCVKLESSPAVAHYSFERTAG